MRGRPRRQALPVDPGNEPLPLRVGQRPAGLAGLRPHEMARVQPALAQPHAVAIPAHQFEPGAAAVGEYVGSAVARRASQRLLDVQGEPIDAQLRAIGEEQWLDAETILARYHDRGTDELTNRALKTFGHEQLPFKRFAANAAWYYLMCVSHSLFESFKEDVTAPVIPVTVYADTFRRQLIDTAGKIVRHAGKLIMKVPRATFERLQFDRLFAACRLSPNMTG